MLSVKCLGACKNTFLVSTQGDRLPMPNIWEVGSDGLPTKCRECGGRIGIVDRETCLMVEDEQEINHGSLVGRATVPA